VAAQRRTVVLIDALDQFQATTRDGLSHGSRAPGPEMHG
jgi:hypothetical protein